MIAKSYIALRLYTTLNSVCTLAHLMFTTTQSIKYYYYAHSTYEEISAEQLSNLPKVI